MNLNSHPFVGKRPGPVVLCIMDGIGYSGNDEGDAYKAASTPNLDWLHAHCAHRPVSAHGLAVGLPDDGDMGNSEVGHNAIGGGRIVAQGAKLVNNALETGAMYEGVIWRKLLGNVLSKGSTLHFLGLFSDGNVHAHINHLKTMMLQAKKEGVKAIRIHALIDGRDVGETSALEYIEPFEAWLTEFNTDGMDAKIASGGGRMQLTMDRYNADWSMVQRGWDTHVKGLGRRFKSATEAVKTFRDETGCVDQHLPAFVIDHNGEPAGKICDGDSVIFYNFRGDRSIEISRAFEETEFSDFERGELPDIEYAGMMEYDGDEHIPKQYLVAPPAIKQPLGEYLAHNGISQYAISETQKFGHVTFFFNGNRSGKFDDKLETFKEIPSDLGHFEMRPWMKAVEITAEVLKTIQQGDQDFIRLNYANGDMVGHTGDFNAARIAVEVVDMQVGRLMQAVKKANGVLIVTADHGNCDEMFEFKKGKPVTKEDGSFKAKTSHSLNPVPFIIYDPIAKNDFVLDTQMKGGLGNIASTCLNFLGLQEPTDYDRSLIIKK